MRGVRSQGHAPDALPQSIMKITIKASLLAAAVFAVSCDRKESVLAEGRPALVQPASKQAWKETDFTPWMSRAELQVRQENNAADQYFARVEGRNNGGMREYRAAIKPFPADRYDQWAVFWGIDDKELFEWEVKLLKSGFSREEMQIFEDAGGRVYHQIVWLKPLGESSGDNQSLAVTGGPPSQEPSQPAPPASLPEPVSTPEPAPEPDLAPPPVIEPVAEAPVPAPVAESIPMPVPPPVPAPPAAPEEPVAAEPSPKAAPTEEVAKPVKKTVYSVKAGDTLGKIAKQKGVTVAELKAANSLKNDILRIGQKLVIPSKQ
jgi:LysM repeat protein